MPRPACGCPTLPRGALCDMQQLEPRATPHHLNNPTPHPTPPAFSPPRSAFKGARKSVARLFCSHPSQLMPASSLLLHRPSSTPPSTPRTGAGGGFSSSTTTAGGIGVQSQPPGGMGSYASPPLVPEDGMHFASLAAALQVRNCPWPWVRDSALAPPIWDLWPSGICPDPSDVGRLACALLQAGRFWPWPLRRPRWTTLLCPPSLPCSSQAGLAKASSPAIVGSGLRVRGHMQGRAGEEGGGRRENMKTTL